MYIDDEHFDLYRGIEQLTMAIEASWSSISDVSNIGEISRLDKELNRIVKALDNRHLNLEILEMKQTIADLQQRMREIETK
jgi:hypothetical protein